MHGVHPKAKAIPMTGGAQDPRLDGRTWKRRSRSSHDGLISPAKASPMTMMTTPASSVSPV